MNPAIYLIDTSGLFRILQGPLREAWLEEMTAGVIAVCPVAEIEFLFSARSLAGLGLEKQRLLRTVFGWQPMAERAYERAEAVQQLLTGTGAASVGRPCRPAHRGHGRAGQPHHFVR